ncbi:phospholipase D family protein [Pontiellaceae bacterium B12219]|nr:phospholipase D family protein [Pontiellaceae bacterium B12219]
MFFPVMWNKKYGVQILVGVMLLSAGCAHLPKDPEKAVSYSQMAPGEGLLPETADAVLAGHGTDESAFMLIPRNSDALNWRLALIDSARQSIDLQVFIWSDDESGRLLLSRIIAAAGRGVKVRLLVDDLPKDWSDRGIALVARIPNIELRRFNPGRVRKGLLSRTLQMSTQFKTLNRRMHNKQMLVDGCWGVVGGRNIGNPYFGLSSTYNNRDLDLLLTGSIIQDLAVDFDEYWNSWAAYPGEAMYKEISPEKEKKLWAGFGRKLEEDRKLLKQTPIAWEPVDWSEAFSTLPKSMVKGVAESRSDSPKVRGDRGERLIEQLVELSLNSNDQVSVITPYMIPPKEFLNEVVKVINEDKRTIRFLVPSMESNNHTMAHSHYKKYRKKLLNAGALLYEFKGEPSAELRALSDTPPIRSDFISLHTKAFVVDERWVLLGSLNVDPRSIHINTEHMLIIDSQELARQLLEQFDTMISPENAWAVTLNENGKLRWTSKDGVKKNQPARGFRQRCADFLWRWIPVESQL